MATDSPLDPRRDAVEGFGMAETPSTFALSPGSKAPPFKLQRAAGGGVDFASVAGERGTLVAFVCNHCPYVIHLAKELGEFAREIAGKGVATVAISSNDVENYPADAPEKMVEAAREWGWDFPYLYDESQEVAKAYGAACTPDFFLFDGNGELFYAGQFDDTRPKSGQKPDGADMRVAVETMLAGKAPAASPKPSTGCNIKWKKGNEPPYFG